MRTTFKKAITLLLIVNVSIIVASLVIGMYAIEVKANERATLEQEEKTQAIRVTEEVGLVCLASAVSVLGSCLAAGIALKAVVTAGFAAMVERPELRTYTLIFAGLAEGIAIYGLLIAIMILSKI